MTAEASRSTENKDVFAFAATIAFAICVYTVPAEWIPGFATLRPALVTSTLAIGLMIARRLATRERFHFDGLRGWALIALVIVAAASISWSLAPADSRFGAIELAKLALFYFTIVNVVSTPRRLSALCVAILIASIVTSIGTIIWYLGGTDLVEGYRARWYGVYADPNRMAMNLLVVVPIAAAFIARKEEKWFIRALAFGSAALAVVCIVISHSRGGAIGLACALAVWAVREKRRGISIAMGVTLVLALIVFAPSSFWNRTDTVAGFHEDASAMGRVYGWQIASKINLDRPLLGVGMGAFRYAWAVYAPSEAFAAYHSLVSHNLFLDVLGELGWVGMFLFLIFAGGASGSAFAASKDGEIGWLARGIAAAVVGYLVTQLSAGYILSSHLYLLFGLAAASRRLAESRHSAIELYREARPLEPQVAYERG